MLKLLVAEAASHERVMTNPAPEAFFMGFGDSALNFELRFWSESQDIWFQLKSDVTVAVCRALTEAGIEIPFPQRDLHLRTVDPSIREPVASRRARAYNAACGSATRRWPPGADRRLPTRYYQRVSSLHFSLNFSRRFANEEASRR